MKRAIFAVLSWNIVVLAVSCSCTLAADSRPTPSDMLESALPAVVTIGVYAVEEESAMYGFSSVRANAENAYSRMLALTDAKGSGSGFVVRHNGKLYVVTNAHVVEQAGDGSGTISVFSINRTKYPMRVIGGDTLYDLAVLGFEKEPGKEIAFLEFRGDDPRIGETVYAIGNPLGEFPYSISQGIIGGKNRMRDGITGRFGFLQSTATLIWGNSGGPLVDAAGKVVGINSQIHATSTPAGAVLHPQLNFALESRIARGLVKEILEKGEHQRAYAGVVFTQATSRGEQQNPVVSFMVPGSPAFEGLSGMEGASVRKVNGQEVRNLDEIFGELEATPAGGQLKVELEIGRERVVRSFKTALLQPDLRSKLTNAALRKLAGIEVMTERGKVFLVNASCTEPLEACGKGAILVLLAERKEENEILKELPAPFEVFSAGRVAAQGESKMWKVRKRQNLESAIRLSSMGGVVAFSGSVLGKGEMFQILLTEDGENLNHALLY